MTLATIDDQDAVLRGIQDAVGDQPQWEAIVGRAVDPSQPQQAHIAVMREPYLTYVLDGRKRVESRFSRTRLAPYGEVRAGDLLLLKEMGGPITGVAEVAHANSYALDPGVWSMLRDRFGSALCVDDAFWKERQSARYATLMSLREATAIRPVPIDKQDRRGWVVLASEPRIHRDQMALLEHDDQHLRLAQHRLVFQKPVSSPSPAQLRLI